MKSVYRIHSKVYPEAKHYFMYADPNQKEDIIVEGDEITVKANENVKDGCITKTLRSIKYLLSIYPDIPYVVRTNMSTYFNLENLKKAVCDLPQDSPCLYGYHTGGMAYGYYMVWNNKAMKILSNVYIEYACQRNINDDTALSWLSQQLNFQCLWRKNNSSDVYDDICFNGFKPKDVKDDWVLFKQKTDVTEIRLCVERYVMTDFLKKYDVDVYKFLDNEEIKPSSIIRILDYLSFIEQSHVMEYNIDVAMKYLQRFDGEQINKLILHILKFYRNNLEVGYSKLKTISSFHKPKEIEAEMLYFNFYTEWRNKRFFDLFF